MSSIAEFVEGLPTYDERNFSAFSRKHVKRIHLSSSKHPDPCSLENLNLATKNTSHQQDEKQEPTKKCSSECDEQIDITSEMLSKNSLNG